MSTATDSGPVAVSGVTYQRAEDGYFEKRQLKRTAGVWGLWGMGVAAVISGNFHCRGAEMNSWTASAPIARARSKTRWGPPALETCAPIRMSALSWSRCR